MYAALIAAKGQHINGCIYSSALSLCCQCYGD